MDKIKAQLLKIQQQLAGLSATQKMLTASLVAIMLITLVWWAKSASTTDLEPVFSAAMTPEEANSALKTLQAHGIVSATLSNGQIMVPGDQKASAAAALAYEGTMPSEVDPKEVLNLISPFDGPQKIQLTEKAVLESKLNSVVRSFPGVASATVILNTDKDTRIGEHDDPTAAVTVNTRQGQANPLQLTKSITNTIAGAVGGMKRENVSVVIDNVAQQNGSNAEVSDEQDQRVWKWEKDYELKLTSLLKDDDAIVSIKADLDGTNVHSESHVGDPDKSVVKEKRSESQTMEQTSGSASTGEPGAVPNAPVALATASGGAAAPPTVSTTTEKTSSENEVMIARTDTQTDKVRGAMLVKSAGVRIALSKLIEHYKTRHPSSKDPSDADLDAFSKLEFEKVARQVVMTLSLDSAEKVAIDVYYDSPPPAPVSQEIASPATASMVAGYGKPAILGLLAVASLFMVASMVKKGTPAPALPIPIAPIVDRGPMTLSALGELAGIVNDDSTGSLEGVELDERQIKTTRIVEQVSTMVKENPEAAADLVKRWMSRT